MEKNLFLGSSIISKWNVCHFFPKSANINLGVTGMTTDKLNVNYESIITNIDFNKGIKNIIVYIGSNDVELRKNENDIVINICSFLNLLQNNNKKAKIIYIAIMKTPNTRNEQLKKIEYINKKIKEFMNSLQNFLFCNFNRHFISTNNYETDKRHLCFIGYSKLTHLIQDVIK